MKGNGGLNTLEYAQRLEQSGVPREQAETHATLFYEVLESHLATKQDLKKLELKITGTLYKVVLTASLTVIGLILGGMVFLGKFGLLVPMKALTK